MRPLLRLSPLLIRRSSHAPRINPPSSWPRLPEKDQAEFESLLKRATSSADTAPAASDEITPIPTRVPKPEFDGDKNPHTGEINGPKSEPLRWGSTGDWSYNGRVTDF